jgi:hypothetical protein
VYGAVTRIVWAGRSIRLLGTNDQIDQSKSGQSYLPNCLIGLFGVSLFGSASVFSVIGFMPTLGFENLMGGSGQPFFGFYFVSIGFPFPFLFLFFLFDFSVFIFLIFPLSIFFV